jgi:hypothetical protein
VPAVTIVEIVVIRTENNVIGRINPHIEAQARGGYKKWRGIEKYRWRSRNDHPGKGWRQWRRNNDPWPWYTDIDINADFRLCD